jgi:nucleotide-binding universal stress UspA family protein
MQPPVNKIILGTDFSETSKDAVHFAVWIAKALGAELRPLHVFDKSKWNVPAQYYQKPGFDEVVSEVEETKQRGKDALKELAKSSGIEAETIFTEGRAGEEVVRVATDLDADLIIMGTHGYSGWKRFTLGSVAEFVSRHAPCSVLTIRPKKK